MYILNFTHLGSVRIAQENRYQSQSKQHEFIHFYSIMRNGSYVKMKLKQNTA